MPDSSARPSGWPLGSRREGSGVRGEGRGVRAGPSDGRRRAAAFSISGAFLPHPSALPSLPTVSSPTSVLSFPRPPPHIRSMANKRERHAAILELIGARPVGSQEELRKALRQRGWDVTQSTLSRDLHELRVARIPCPDGPRY